MNHDLNDILTMKRLYIIIMILMPLLNAAAMTENPDTLVDVVSPEQLVITETAQGMTVRVADKETVNTVMVSYGPEATVRTSQKTSHSLLRLPFSKDCCKDNCDDRWTLGVSGICIGLTDANGQPAPGGLQWAKSFEISWMSCINANYSFSRSTLSLGLGFDWRNYKATTNGAWLTATPEGGIAWGTAPEGAQVRYSRLKVFSLQVPLLYSWAIPKTSLAWRMGPIACFNTYSSLKGIYDDSEGNRCEYFTKALDRRPFTVDFFGCLSYRHYISLYIRYSPMKVMKTGSPINFSPLTIGFGFGI